MSHFPRDRESLVGGLFLLVKNHPWRSAKKTADRYRAFPSSFEEGTKGWWQTFFSGIRERREWTSLTKLRHHLLVGSAISKKMILYFSKTNSPRGTQRFLTILQELLCDLCVLCTINTRFNIKNSASNGSSLGVFRKKPKRNATRTILK